LPGFKAFKWEESAKSSGKYKLSFEVEKGREPCAAAVEIALRIIENESKLPSLIVSNLWNEFNGRGKKSEMWWHGALDQVAENFQYGELPPPATAKDLLPVMRLDGIFIRESLYSYKKPIAELTFSALFEEEHGVGILTDGNKILGNGYSCQTSLYEPPADSATAPEEEEAQPTEEDLVKAQKEMQKMAKEFATIFGRQEEKHQKKWQKLFPPPPPETPVTREIAFLCGDWKYDAHESARVLKALKNIKTNIAADEKAFGRNLYRISPKALKYLMDGKLMENYRVVECRRQGSQVIIDVCSKSGWKQTWKYWCDGEVLVSDAGLAYRRA